MKKIFILLILLVLPGCPNAKKEVRTRLNDADTQLSQIQKETRAILATIPKIEHRTKIIKEKNETIQKDIESIQDEIDYAEKTQTKTIPVEEITAPAKSISHATTQIAVNIEDMEKEFPNISNPTANINTKTESIKRELKEAGSQLDFMENKEMLWERVLKTALWVVPLGIIAFILVYLGIGKIVQPLMAGAGLWVSRQVKRSAELDEKVVKGEITIQEAVAARRAGEPGYEGYRKRLKKKNGRENETQNIS